MSFLKCVKLTFSDQLSVAKNSKTYVSDQNIHKFLAGEEETEGEEPEMKMHEKDIKVHAGRKIKILTLKQTVKIK